jgi:serine/threonine protein kinase
MFQWNKFQEYADIYFNELGLPTSAGFKLSRKIPFFANEFGNQSMILLQDVFTKHYRWFRMAGKKQYLGMGANGKVKLLEDEAQNYYALKISVISKGGSADDIISQKKSIENEKKALALLNNLVAVGTNEYQDYHKYYIAQKRILGTPLSEWKNALITPEKQILLANSLLHQVYNIHTKGIVHTDLHDENLMLNCDYLTDYYTINIIDYGECKIYREGLKTTQQRYIGVYRYDYIELSNIIKTYFPAASKLYQALGKFNDHTMLAELQELLSLHPVIRN